MIDDPTGKTGKLIEITNQKQLVKDHLVENAGNFDFAGEDEDG